MQSYGTFSPVCSLKCTVTLRVTRALSLAPELTLPSKPSVFKTCVYLGDLVLVLGFADTFSFSHLFQGAPLRGTTSLDFSACLFLLNLIWVLPFGQMPDIPSLLSKAKQNLLLHCLRVFHPFLFQFALWGGGLSSSNYLRGVLSVLPAPEIKVFLHLSIHEKN